MREASDLSSNHARGGDRRVVTAEFEATRLTQSSAPFVSDARRRLPVGVEFVVWGIPKRPQWRSAPDRIQLNMGGSFL